MSEPTEILAIHLLVKVQSTLHSTPHITLHSVMASFVYQLLKILG